MTNPVARFEITATDLKGMRTFYGQLFGWDTSNDDQRYSLVRARDGIGGLILKAEAGLPTFVTVYVEVDDVEQYLKKVEQLGGTIYVPPTESPVPGEKLFAVFGDPEDNLIGICERT